MNFPKTQRIGDIFLTLSVIAFLITIFQIKDFNFMLDNPLTIEKHVDVLARRFKQQIWIVIQIAVFICGLIFKFVLKEK